MDAVGAVMAGIVVGTLTGLVPGLHVNLLAALALTVPDLPPEAALGILAVGTVHTFVAILPSTYLGAPADGLSVLPAHRLLREGAAPEAVRLSLAASLVAALGAVAMLWPYQRILRHAAVLPFIEAAAPAILCAVPMWLALRDRNPLAAGATAALAALLGHLAWDHPVAGRLPGSALLPLLSGLFGVPALVWAMRARQSHPTPEVPPRHLDRGLLGGCLRGLAAAGWTAVLPGLTAAVASAMALPAGRSPRQALVSLSAVNTAHLMLTMGVLWITGRTRSGLAIAWQSLHPVRPWVGAPPPDLLAAAATMLVAGTAAVLATAALDGPYRRAVASVRPGVAEAVALVIVVALCWATTGWPGLVLLAVASLVGAVPLWAGTRRIHLAAALSIPIAFRLAFA